MRVLPITQGEQGIVQVLQGPRLAEYFAFEAAGAVGRFTVAKGADYKQCTLGLVEIVFSQFGKRAHVYRQTGCLQLTGTLPGKLLGKAALTGKAHQPALTLGGGR
ncbi:hypothetical protein D3C77_572160 [compost metagenome]